MITPAGRATLFERDDELAALDAMLARLRDGTGGVHVIEGPAGIGKTSLLGAAVAAGAPGITVLTARGTELEQSFAFAVARQLFAPATARLAGSTRWAEWAGGAGARAAAVLDHRRAPDGRVGTDAAGGTDVCYAVLHGLYWLAVELSDDAPLLVVVDDAHWADEPSLQALQFLATRVDSVPIALLIAARPGRPALATVTATAGTVSRPQDLGVPAVMRMVDRLGSPSDDGFARALHRAAGGNPLLVTELVAEVSRTGIAPREENAGHVAQLTPESVVAATTLRLSGLPESATRLADAVAVLERARITQAAALAGLDAPAAVAAFADLRARGVLCADDPRRPGADAQFAHPVLRAVVHGAMDERDRAAAHLHAARLLSADGAATDVVAAHLLHARPVEDPWAATILRTAARRAASVEALHDSAQLLTAARAALPVGSPDRFGIDLELGDVLTSPEPDAAAAILTRVLHDATGPDQDDERVRAVVGLARLERLRGRGADVVDMLLRVRAEHAHVPALAAALDAELLATSAVSCRARLELRPRLSEHPPSGPLQGALDHVRTAGAGLDVVLDGRPAHLAVELASRAAAGARTALAPPLYAHVMSVVGLTYLCCDRVPEARAVFDELVERTREPDLRSRHATMLAQRASVALHEGRLDDAELDAARALDLGSASAAVLAILPRAAAVLVTIAVERGTPPPVRYLTDDLDPDSMAHRQLAYSRAGWLFAQQHHPAAAEAYLAYGRRNLDLGYAGVASPWRSQAALSLAASGQTRRAHDLAQEELDVARRSEVPSGIGAALRACGLLGGPLGGPRGVELLDEAVDVLAASPSVLARARALASLAAAHAAAGRLPDARVRLRTARDLAADAGAHRLLRTVDAALHAAGARPSTRRASGAEALTPAERETCALAVQGRGNREIAQVQFVTEKTVEAHLRSAYRKLGIRSRQQLPEVLRPPAGQTLEPPLRSVSDDCDAARGDEYWPRPSRSGAPCPGPETDLRPGPAPSRDGHAGAKAPNGGGAGHGSLTIAGTATKI